MAAPTQRVASAPTDQQTAVDQGKQQQMQRSRLQLLCFTVFLYAVCFMAQAPLLPYMVSKLHADSSYYYGLLMSTFSALQLLGSLMSGPLADYYGGRSLLLVSFAASAVCYVMTATATSIWMLFISRLATVMQHAVLAARTIVTAACPPSERAAVLGYIGASYGVGFAVGPAVGGWLSSISLTATAWAAAAGSLLALLVVLLGLPDDHVQSKPPPSRQQQDSSSPPASKSTAGVNISSILSVCRCPGVPQLLLVQAGAGLAQATFQSTFSLVMQQQFGVDSKTNGMVLSYVGLCIVAAQSLLIQPLSKGLGEAQAVTLCCGVLSITFATMSAGKALWHILVCLLPLAAAGVTVGTLNTARLTKAVGPHQAGTVMALDMSIGSGLRTASPLLGIWLFKQYGYSAVCFFMSAVMAIVFSLQLLLQKQRTAQAALESGADKKHQ